MHSKTLLEPEKLIFHILFGLASTYSTVGKKAMNQDVSTGLLAPPFTRSLIPSLFPSPLFFLLFLSSGLGT